MCVNEDLVCSFRVLRPARHLVGRGGKGAGGGWGEEEEEEEEGEEDEIGGSLFRVPDAAEDGGKNVTGTASF
jgi:hypothetical protein